MLPADPIAATEESNAAIEVVTVPPKEFRFYSGEKLTPDEGSELLHYRKFKVILCAGARSAGKTTFLARIGEIFRRGQLINYQFAGSKTLCAFERLSWLASIPSGSPKPDTPRTLRGEKDRFLHLEVCSTDAGKERHNLLISDLPGEEYPTAIASKDFCKAQLALSRADILLLFLDCEKLSDQAMRHAEKDNSSIFLRQVASVKKDAKFLRVIVILSRWDYITAGANEERDRKFCEDLENDFLRSHADKFATMKFWKIAARPSGAEPTNKEIQDIFDSWMKNNDRVTDEEYFDPYYPDRDFSAFRYHE